MNTLKFYLIDKGWIGGIIVVDYTKEEAFKKIQTNERFKLINEYMDKPLTINDIREYEFNENFVYVYSGDLGF